MEIDVEAVAVARAAPSVFLVCASLCSTIFVTMLSAPFGRAYSGVAAGSRRVPSSRERCSRPAATPLWKITARYLRKVQRDIGEVIAVVTCALLFTGRGRVLCGRRKAPLLGCLVLSASLERTLDGT